MKQVAGNVELPERGSRNQVGLHLDLDALRVVEVSHGRIKDWVSVPYPAGLAPGDAGFPEFLRKALADLPGVRHAGVWVVGPTPSLQVRFLSLAKVRPRQLSNLVYWTFRKEIPFDAAQVIFDYAVEGEVSTVGQARRIDATAYTVAHEDVDQLSGMLGDAGLPLDGVAIPSFAMRAVMRSIVPASPETVVGLYVGSDSSAIMFIKQRQVVAHRVFKTGMNAMLDVLRDRYPDWSPAKAYREMSRVLREAPVDEKAGRIRETVQAAYARLIQQVERSISAFLVGRSEEDIKSLYVAGSLAGLPSLVSELGSKLGLTSEPLNGFGGPMPVAPTPVPLTPETGGLMAIALGAALLDPVHAPNLLHTYAKRDHEARMTRASRRLSMAGVAGIALLLVALAAVARFNQGLREELAGLQKRIEQFAPYPDQAMVLDMVARAAMNSAQLKGAAQRCLPVAALNQLSRHTPEDIRLRAIQFDSLTPAGEPADVIRLIADGVVSGDPGRQESKLASYVMRLEDTPLFDRVTLGRTGEGHDGRDQVLLFNIQMELEPLAERGPALAVALPATKGAIR